MNAVLKNAVKGKWLREEEKWGEFVVTVPTNKYDFREKARVDTDDVFKISVGGRDYAEVKNWEKGKVRDIEVEIHGEAFKYNDNWNYGVKMSFVGFVVEKENPFKGKEPAKKDEPEDDLPF
jgi:hypothetical protein